MNDEQAAVDAQQDMSKPARKQVLGAVTTGPQRKGGQQGGPTEVNLWSGKQLGPRGERGSKDGRRQQPSAYRCKPILDSGKTKGSQGNVDTFCIFFAKGMCSQGPDCPYLHRLPTSADNAAMARNISMDIFGREKMPADSRGYKKGAGSYELDMTTLYVHYGGAGHYAVPQLRHLLLQNFGEFGPVRHIHIVPAKTIAFIRFHWRVTAEFAREAMDQQQLTGSTLNEVLSVRWAYDDPNPVAVVGRKRQALDAVEAAGMAAWDALPPEEKRARLAIAHQAHAQRVSAVASALPEPLMAASAAGAYAADDSYDAWRGLSSGSSLHLQEQGWQQPDAVAAGAGGAADPGVSEYVSLQQVQEAGAEGSTDAQDAAAAWQEYHAEWGQHQQQQGGLEQGQGAAGQQAVGAQGLGQGSWFQGWRQRDKPQTFADNVGAAARACGAAGTAPAGGQGGGTAEELGGSGGGLGLLAGYGSDSDSGDALPGVDSSNGSKKDRAEGPAPEQLQQPP